MLSPRLVAKHAHKFASACRIIPATYRLNAQRLCRRSLNDQ
jgi:hypothetical protein